VIARARALLVVAVALVASVIVAPARTAAAQGGPSRAFVLLAPGATLERLLDVDGIAALARRGGAGWLAPPLDDDQLSTLARPMFLTGPVGNRNVTVVRVPRSDTAGLERGLGIIRAGTADVSNGPVMVALVGTSGSAGMVAAGDDLRPVVLAVGTGRDLFTASGALRTLTSDSTRRVGVVASADVLATLDGFLGHLRRDGGGHEIGFVDDPPPFELHERYLAMRRMTVPVQTAAALFVTIAGLFALVVLWLGRKAPTGFGVLATGTAISVGPLAAALLAAGHLPTLSYASVVPFVVVVTAILVGLVLLGATRELLHPVLPLGLVLLAFLLVEDAVGWTGAQTPFLGGSELDGGRFFGLPNVFIGLLLGAALYTASRLRPVIGFAILLAAAVFAGLPTAGANLGGAITLFTAAGLWLPLRTRGRLGWRELAFALAVVIVGTGAVLLAHRLSSLPTHVTRFEESAGAGGAWSVFVDRLGVGWRLIERNPFALVPVVGLLATLGAVLRPPAVIGPSLARHPAWRDALLVLLLASVVAYVVNDSGPAACGVGFGMALGGLLYVSVAERTWKMVPV
jgi:hypothetical protein